jgi:sugar-specific transcriptional regulator TrmB
LALKALKSLGLTDMDAQVYVYLSKKGPHEENDLADALNLTKHQLCLSIDSLLTRGMVSTIPERSTKYFAIPLEKVLDEFMKVTKEQAKALQASRKELLSTWRSMIEKDATITKNH